MTRGAGRWPGRRPDHACCPVRVRAMTRPRYPFSRRLALTDDLHGHLVPDPYRWLEDAASDQTRAWLADQEELFAATAATWPGRERFAARTRELLGARHVSPPTWPAERQFFMRRAAAREHPVLLVSMTSPGPRGPASDNR